jgi:hypothetical protein
MTTKQGLLYNKKNEKYIENMQQRPDPMEHANQQANPFIYQKAAEKNVKFADEALTGCKNMCDAKFSNDEREACYLGCDIKNNATSADDLSLFDKRSINNPYDKIKKEITKTVNKTSDKKVSSAYKKWDPPNECGCITTAETKLVPYDYTAYKSSCRRTWSWRQFGLRRVCKQIPFKQIRYRKEPVKKWGIVKKGKQTPVPAVWEKCEWQETHKYPEENVGTFSEQVNVGSCGDFITDKNIPDGNPEYYRDYSKHQLETACKAGMDNYERKNCVVNTYSKTMSCTGKTKYGSLLQDSENLDQEMIEYNKFIYETPSAVEGFSNACKSKCSQFIENPSSVDDMSKDDKCYKCEVKNNVFIRNDKARDEWLDNLFYIATPENTMEAKLSKLKKQYDNSKDALKKQYDNSKDALKKLHDVEFLPKNQKTNNIKIKETGTYVDLKQKYKTIYDKLDSMTYSEKKNATINAYLEDMDKRTPRKNIEYGLWLGLLVAAGITTVTLIKD